MLPCYICGRDASTGWIKGFVPAPDSQKLALCAEHNTAENRRKVAGAWNSLLSGEIRSALDASRQKVSPALHLASVQFAGGGLLTFPCTACAPTDHNTLRIDAPDGASTYIPMQHIREYTVRPFVEDAPALAESASGNLDSTLTSAENASGDPNRQLLK